MTIIYNSCREAGITNIRPACPFILTSSGICVGVTVGGTEIRPVPPLPQPAMIIPDIILITMIAIRRFFDIVNIHPFLVYIRNA